MDNTLKRNPYPFTNGNVLKSMLHDASSALLAGSYRLASTQYKSAIDDLDSGYPYSISEPSDSNLLIIRYALCTAQIQLGDYPNLASAVEQLTDLIKNGHAKILPALYYALAKAYRLLFRFNNAKDLLAEGKRFLDRIDVIKVFYWPETEILIPETVRHRLEGSMEFLKRECGAISSPDARCKYQKCLEISDHVVPSENIYFRDPKFSPFLVLTCEEKCKVEFHEVCWKNMKKESDGIDKPKDMLGQPCPTKDCVTSNKESSVVVEVKLVKGDRPEDEKIYTLQNLQIKKPPINAKKKTKAEKDKCDEKVIAPLDKNKVKKKEKKVCPEFSPPGVPGQDTKLYEPPFEEQLAPKLELLEKLRKINFGFKSSDIMNPEEVHYGNPQVRELALRRVFLDSLTCADSEAFKKEFDLSMFYEFIKKNGIQNIKDINALKDIDGIDANGITDIWQLLLESRRFCAVGDKIGISDDLPNLYKSAESEIIDSTSQVVLGNVMKPSNRSPRMNTEETNMGNTFQLFPPMHSGSSGLRSDMARSDMTMLNADTALNNFANDAMGSWSTAGFMHLRPPPPVARARAGDIGSSDLNSVASDKNSTSDTDAREFNAFSMDNLLNANLAMKSVPIRNEHKSSVHSISSEDALNDNLDMRRNENYSIGTAFDYQPFKNGDVEDSVGGVPFSDKIDLSHIYQCYMGPRWVNEDQKANDLQKDRHIEKLKEAVKQCQQQNRQMEENYLRSQLELTQSLEKKQTEIESLRITIKNFESLLDEKSKKFKDLEAHNKTLEQDFFKFESRILDMWKQHEDFIVKTINQRCSERVATGHQLKKYLSESDRKKLEDEMHILEANELRSIESSRRTDDFFKQAQERLRFGVRNYYIPEHTVDTNLGAFIVDQALNFLQQGHPSGASSNGAENALPFTQANKILESADRSTLPYDNFWQNQPPNRPVPPLMSLPVNRPLVAEAQPQFPPPGPPPMQNRNQSALSQSSSRSSTPQPAAQLGGSAASNDSSHLGVARPASAEVSAAAVAKSFPAGGAKPKAPAAPQVSVAPPVPAPPQVSVAPPTPSAPALSVAPPKIAPLPTKLPSSEKASVPFLIEPIRSATNFSTLTEEMTLIFPAVARQDIVKGLKLIKAARPNKTLNGMSAQTIADRLEALLGTKEFKKCYVGLEKFSSAAWGAAPNTSNNWKGSDENECHICTETMDVKYFLQCKHAFHETCINEWGKRNAECPLCRKYFKTDRNYPELRSAAN